MWIFGVGDEIFPSEKRPTFLFVRSRRSRVAVRFFAKSSGTEKIGAFA